MALILIELSAPRVWTTRGGKVRIQYSSNLSKAWFRDLASICRRTSQYGLMPKFLSLHIKISGNLNGRLKCKPTIAENIPETGVYGQAFFSALFRPARQNRVSTPGHPA